MSDGMIIGGRYQVLRMLGKGGMKVVFLARDMEACEAMEVAVAVLKSFDGRIFESEVELAAKVNSQYVVRILDSGVDENGAYVVTEYCQGPSLSEELMRVGALPVESVLRLTLDLARGLGAMHKSHVLHRDFKLENAIMTDQCVKIIDFGLSRESPDSLTDIEPPVPLGGTLPYMAPEAFVGESEGVDARTDVYAFGVCMFRLLVNRYPLSPIRGEGWQRFSERLSRLGAHDLTPLEELGVPADVATLVGETIKLVKEQRPRMHEVVRRLEYLLADKGHH